LVLPLRVGDELAGFIGFDNTRNTGKWPEEDIMLLRFCAEIMGSAINRKRNHENLEKSKEWFRAIADYTYDLESWHGIDGKLLWVNPAVERLTGYTVDECMNMPDYPLPFVHEDDRDDIAKSLKQAVEEKTSEDNLPFRIVRKDNTMRWVNIAWQPIYNEAKAYIGIRTSIRDISLQKLAEETLQESEERHRSLINDVLDSSAVGICIVDAGYNIIWANSALERYFGVSRSHIIGKDSRELVQNRIKHIFEDPESFASKILASYQHNTYSERFECHVLQGPCRQERWLEHRSMPIRSGLYTGGRIEHYYDITIRKHVEENLHHSQRMLQLILDSIPVRVFWKDLDSVFLGCNQAFAKDTGLQSADEVIGKTDDDFVMKKDEVEFIKQFDSRVVQSGQPEYHTIRRHFRPDGTEAWLEANRIPLRNSDGKIVGILGTYEDVTERKNAEEEIQRLNRELEERVAKRTAELTKAHKHLLREIRERKALEKEILGISEKEKRMIGQELHDSIGQQLMGISFLTKVLEGKLAAKLPEEAVNAKSIADLVNQAMDQTRALARGLHPVDLDGGSLISALQDLVISMEKLFPVSCSLRIDDSVIIDDATVAVNLYRITQEAITNAIKHGKARNIHVELTSSNDRTFLIVKNDGLNFPGVLTGVPGMGLRVMDHRAEMIGGSLNIRRNIGGGTVVTCCFLGDKFKC
jgi:PAS domain S-box-containing protein